MPREELLPDLRDVDRPPEADVFFELFADPDDAVLLCDEELFDLLLPPVEPPVFPFDFDDDLLRVEPPLLPADDDRPLEERPVLVFLPDDFDLPPVDDRADEDESFEVPEDATDSAAAPTAPTAAPVTAPPSMSPATSSTLSITREVVDLPDELPEPDRFRDELLFL